MKSIYLMGMILLTVPLMCGAGEGDKGEGHPRQERRAERGERDRFEKHGPPEGGLPRLLERPEAWERLGLSEGEATKLRRRLEELEAEEKALMEKSRELAREQAALLHQETPSKDEVFARIEEIGTLRTEMAKLRMARLFAIRDVLGAERMKELRGHMERRNRRKGRPQERRNDASAME